MTIPLVMLGPGGDYTTRLNIKGRQLIRQTGASREQQPDTETAGSMAGWSGRRRKRRQPVGSTEPAGAAPVSSRHPADTADTFELAPAGMNTRMNSGTYDARGRGVQPARATPAAAPAQPPEHAVGMHGEHDQQGDQGEQQASRTTAGTVPGTAPGAAQPLFAAAAAWLDQQRRQLSAEHALLIRRSTMANGAAAAPASAAHAQRISPLTVTNTDDRSSRTYTLPAALRRTNLRFASPAPAAPGHAHNPGVQANAHRLKLATLATTTLATANKTTADANARHAPHHADSPSHQELRHGSQPDAPATADSHPHPRHAAGPRLFPDDAGARRRARRQQGHRLRARRGAHQKRGAHPAGQQGALFAA